MSHGLNLQQKHDKLAERKPELEACTPLSVFLVKWKDIDPTLGLEGGDKKSDLRHGILCPSNYLCDTILNTDGCRILKPETCVPIASPNLHRIL